MSPQPSASQSAAPSKGRTPSDVPTLIASPLFVLLLTLSLFTQHAVLRHSGSFPALEFSVLAVNLFDTCSSHLCRPVIINSGAAIAIWPEGSAIRTNFSQECTHFTFLVHFLKISIMSPFYTLTCICFLPSS